MSGASRVRRGSSAEQVVERDPREDRGAECVVVEERAETSLRIASSDQPLLPQRERRGGGEPEPVPAAETAHLPDCRQQSQARELHRRDRGAVRAAEEYCGGMHAEREVVV